MKYIIIALLLISFTALHAQNGWKDMGGYKETRDSVWKLYQVFPSSNGKYLNILTSLNNGLAGNITYQKWSIDSGVPVFSHQFNMNAYKQVHNFHLNEDAVTYSLSVKDSVNKLLVKDIETDSILIEIVDSESTLQDYNASVAKVEFDTVLHCFIIAYH